MFSHTIRTKDEFFKALEVAESGDTIVLHQNLTFSSEVDILLKDINLMGIHSDITISWDTPVYMQAFNEKPFHLFRVEGSVKISHLRFEGCYSTLDSSRTLKDWRSDGLQCILKLDRAVSVKIQYCIFTKCNYGAIWDNDSIVTTINNCGFIDIPYNYYGYGIWKGGKGSAINQTLVVSSCTFNVCKHAVAASYHKNNIIAVNNCIQFTKEHAFDRHSAKDAGKDIPGIGGGDYILIGNKFEDDSSYAFGLTVPYPEYKIIISGNEFMQKQGSVGKIDTNVDGVKVVKTDATIKKDNISIIANRYDRHWCPPYCS